jgi:hypothetical protein
MVLPIVLIICAFVIVIALFVAKSKGKDSNGPMNNN